MSEMSTVLRAAVCREICKPAIEKQQAANDTEEIESVVNGTHRFDIHLGQAIFRKPKGFCVNREEDRKDRMERNAAAIKLWDNRYVEVTDDGLVIREHKKPKAKLNLVKSDGRK